MNIQMRENKKIFPNVHLDLIFNFENIKSYLTLDAGEDDMNSSNKKMENNGYYFIWIPIFETMPTQK